MANTPDYFIKNMIGDLAAQVALLRAQLEEAQEELATLKGAPSPDPPPAPLGRNAQ